MDAVGARGLLRRRAAAARGRRRAAGRRRRPVRADEAAAAQRRSPGAGPPRPAGRLRARARGVRGPAVPPVPGRLPRRGGDADAAAGARHRPGRVQGGAGRALRQPRRPRHPRPHLRRGVGPDPAVPAAGAPGEPGLGRGDPPLGRRPRRLGADRRGRRRRGAADRARSTRGATRSRPGALGATTLAFVADRELFGDLVDDDRFVAAYRETLASLRTRGARATVEALAQG